MSKENERILPIQVIPPSRDWDRACEEAAATYTMKKSGWARMVITAELRRLKLLPPAKDTI